MSSNRNHKYHVETRLSDAQTWEGSRSVLSRVVRVVRVVMRGHAPHRTRRVERRHGIERWHHGGGQEGRRWKRRGRGRRARQVDALEDCLSHLLDFGHQLLLQRDVELEEPRGREQEHSATPYLPLTHV